VVVHPLHLVEPKPVSMSSEETGTLCCFYGKFDAAGDMRGHEVRGARAKPTAWLLLRTCLK